MAELMDKVSELYNTTGTHSKNSFFSEISDSAQEEVERQALALLTFSHTKTEQKLYEFMLTETRNSKTSAGTFGVRYLMVKTGLSSYSSICRARNGLIKKLSIEKQIVVRDLPEPLIIYVIFSPHEVLIRRQNAGISSFPKGVFDNDSDSVNSWNLIDKLVKKNDLSRRETQVILRCAEGLTNAEIGKKLFIQEETVKFHLRNIYIKLGVRRRTELMAFLFRKDEQSKNLQR